MYSWLAMSLKFLSSQIWGINVIQKGSGEQNCPKFICDFSFYFRALIKRCVLAEGVAYGAN